jgi:hypothetical protein
MTSFRENYKKKHIDKSEIRKEEYIFQFGVILYYCNRNLQQLCNLINVIEKLDNQESKVFREFLRNSATLEAIKSQTIKSDIRESTAISTLKVCDQK